MKSQLDLGRIDTFKCQVISPMSMVLPLHLFMYFMCFNWVFKFMYFMYFNCVLKFSLQGSYAFFIKIIPIFNNITIRNGILFCYIDACYTVKYFSPPFFFGWLLLVWRNAIIFGLVLYPFWIPIHSHSFSVDSLESSM